MVRAALGLATGQGVAQGRHGTILRPMGAWSAVAEVVPPRAAAFTTGFRPDGLAMTAPAAPSGFLVKVPETG